jgi:hypothetical protein
MGVTKSQDTQRNNDISNCPTGQISSTNGKKKAINRINQSQSTNRFEKHTDTQLE